MYLSSFKKICVFVGSLVTLLAASLFLKGLMPSMAEFLVPPETISSPHYFDAIFWVYLHMIIIGILIILIGFAVTDLKMQKLISLFLFIANLIYTYLDFAHSDSAVGNGLYKGSASLFPAFTALFITVLFLQLTITLHRKQLSTTAP
jgi:hypothetical protein